LELEDGVVPQDMLRFSSHLLELLGPGLLGFPEAVLSLLGLLEASHDLLVVGILLPVLDLLEVIIQQAVLHILVQLAHLVRLRHDGTPRPLQAAVLGTWGTERTANCHSTALTLSTSTR